MTEKNNSEEKICSECGGTIPEGSDECPSCGGKKPSARKKWLGYLVLIGIVAVFAVLMYNTYFNQDELANAKNVAYNGNNISFSIKEYFKPQQLSGDTKLLHSYDNVTYYDYKAVALLSHVEGYQRVGSGERQGNIYINIYRLTGPESLQDLVKAFKVIGHSDMIGATYDEFSITGERNLTVNGMPATEISYLAVQSADRSSGEKGIIAFVEKTPGKVYYVIQYIANYESDFQLDKVNYDLVLNSFKAQ